MRNKYKTKFVFFLIAFIASAVITFTPLPAICDPAKGCDVVLTSSYSHTFGIKNSTYGLVGFFLLSILSLSQSRKPNRTKKVIISLGTILASLVALYFLYIQAFVLDAFCKYCMIVDLSTLIALAILVFFDD